MKKHILHTATRPSKGLAFLLLLLLSTWGRMQAQLIITIEIAEAFDQVKTTTTSSLGTYDYYSSSGTSKVQVYFDHRLMTTDDLKEGSPFATNANSSVNGVVLPLAYDTYFFVKTGDILEFEIAKDEMPTNISFGCDDNNDPEKACEYPANFGFENLAINTWRGTNDFSQSTGVFNLPEDKYYELVFFEETSDTICNQTAEGVTCYDYGGFYLDDYGYPCDPDECIDEEVFNNITEVWIRFRYKWNIPELNVVLSSNTSTPVEDNIINCEEEVKLSIQYIDDYILNKNVTYYWEVSNDLTNWQKIPNTTSSGNVSVTYINEITYTPSVNDGLGNSTRHYRARYHVENEAISSYVYTSHEVYPAAPSLIPITIDDISCHGEKGVLYIDKNNIVGGLPPFNTALAYIDSKTGDLRVEGSGVDKYEYPNLTQNDYILRVTNSDGVCTTPDYDFTITEPSELTYTCLLYTSPSPRDS